MKLLAIAAASAVLTLGTSAYAQQSSSQIPFYAPPPNPVYGELGYTFLKIEDGLGGNARPGALRGLLGYSFHPTFALEGLGAFGIDDDDTTNVVGGVPVRIDYDLKNIWGAYIKPRYTYLNWEVFGRLGYAWTKVGGNATAGPFAASASDSDGDFSYGLGLNYNFSPRVYAGIDYMMYNDSGNSRVHGFTLSAGWRF
jgi:opacity protein-like surface antigen